MVRRFKVLTYDTLIERNREDFSWLLEEDEDDTDTQDYSQLFEKQPATDYSRLFDEQPGLT